MAALKALVDDTKTKEKYVTLVDLGDYLQGGTIGTLSSGKMVIEIMNAMQYDIVTLGNHEFNYGISELAQRIEEASFDIVLSNVRYSGKQKNIFEDVPEFIV